MADLNEFNNNYSVSPVGITHRRFDYSPLDGVFIHTNNTGIIPGDTGNTEVNQVDIDRLISERAMEEYNFHYSIDSQHSEVVMYNGIFSLIRNKLFIINDSEEITAPDPVLLEEIKNKYSFNNSSNTLTDFKRKVVVLHNKKIETEIIFSNNKKEYTKFTDNILILINTIKDFNTSGDEVLIQLLTDKIQWYYSELKLESLKETINSLEKEYRIIKGLLSEFTGLLPATACQICLENQINYFSDPCGHTICTECMEKSKGVRKCHFCRGSITSFKRLYL
jgi:Zinc finger, C3HC4 type (RING finger)